MVVAVRALFDQCRQWTGSATELRDLLGPALSCTTPAGVSKQLRSCTLLLADYGIELKFRHLHGKTRIVELREDPGGASGGAWDSKTSPHPPPDFEAPPQPTETEEVKS